MTDRPSPVTCLSVVGCSGQPIGRKVLKAMVPDRYVASVPDADGGRIKLAGHLRPSAENVALLEERDVDAVLVVRDPRDNLVSLVHRSLHDWCPDKFLRPRTHGDAMAYHRLIKASAGQRGEEPFVRFYVDGIGGRPVLDDIFRVAAWREQPRVHLVRFEDLSGFRTVDPEVVPRTLAGLADFLGVALDGPETSALVARIRAWLGKKLSNEPMFIVGWRDVFTDEDKDLFKERFGSLVVDLGYEADDNW